MAHYFAQSVEVPEEPETVFTLVEPIAESTRHVVVQEHRVHPGPAVTYIDFNPDSDGTGFRLPDGCRLSFLLPPDHGVHAVVADHDVVDKVEVLVTPAPA